MKNPARRANKFIRWVALSQLILAFLPNMAANAVPATPQVLSVSVNSISGATMDVKVTVANPSDPSIVGYQYSTDGGTNWKECNSSNCTWTSGSTQLILQKLSSANSAMSKGSTYTIALKACSTGSPGNSGSTDPTTLGLKTCSGSSTGFVYIAGTPDAPSTVTASSPTSNSIFVTWSLPTNTGGATITDYLIQYSSDNGVTWNLFSDGTSISRSVSVTGLSTSTAYVFRIAAVNSSGNGSYSVQSNSVTTLTVASHNNSSLNSAVIKGVAVSLTSGADTSTITTTDSSTVTLSQIEANSTSGSGTYASTFTAQDVDSATIKVVLYASGASRPTVTEFGNATAYSNQAISDGSYFVVRVISYDTTATSYYIIRNIVEAPVISTNSTITNGATTATVVISGNYFSNSATVSEFTFSAGSSGLSINLVTIDSSTSVTFTLSGTAAAGTITLTALRSAYSPAASASSNTVSIVIDSPPSSGGGGGSAPTPVYVPKPPTITSISAPEVCAVSSQLTIKGTYLGSASVKVDGTAARILSASASELLVALPSAPVGTKTITVTNDDGSATTTVKYSFVDTPLYVDYIYPETYKDRDFKYVFKATDATKYEIVGSLPAGLTLNPLTGEVSGAPAQTGNYVFTILASNICDSMPLNVYMFVDKAIPGAFTCSVAFNNPRTNNISDIKLANLKTCLTPVPDLSPKYISPVIFLSGGVPAGLTADEALTHPRYLPIIALIESMNLGAQIYYGAFSGSTDTVQLNVYWPDPS